MHLHLLKTPAPLSGVSVLSRCTQRGPEHIFAQNYFPCPSPPYCSLQRDGGTTCHAGGGGAQMAHQMCGHGTWREARWCEAGLGADAAGPLGHLISCMPWKGRGVKVFFFFLENISALVYPCSGLSGISSPAQYPAAPQLAAPPYPAATGAPPGPLHLAELAFWALPHQSSLAAAALSCALTDCIGVGQSHSSCDWVWGCWMGGRWRRVRVGGRGGKETPEGSLNEFGSVRWMVSSRYITELNLFQIVAVNGFFREARRSASAVRVIPCPEKRRSGSII